MCGIAGFVNANGSIDSDVFGRVTKQIAHRGPDDHGYLYHSGEGITLSRDLPDSGSLPVCALASRRLAILGLGGQGWQPMATADGRYYIVFNGEIYNYVELREQLEQLGRQFRSQSDTEVLLAAFVEWGKGALPGLVGMFAFAILDVKDRKLILVRDFFGIKPLYYAYWRGGLVFASEIKSLLELPGLKRTANSNGVYYYLRFGITDQSSETLYQEIHQLRPGHCLEMQLDNPSAAKPVHYWKPSLGEKIDVSFEEAASNLRELFLENVRLHLRSDVPLGAALSGGIDSSAIVATMRHLRGRNLEIHAFSYVASDPQLNEERWIELMGGVAGASIHTVRASPGEFVRDIDALVASQDEPFGSTSIYAQYRVFQLAQRAGIKVMLDGQGADEILGGYRYFLGARLVSLIRQGKWVAALSFLRKASNSPATGMPLLLMWAADHLLPENVQRLMRRSVRKSLNPDWMNTAWFKDRGVIAHSFSGRGGREALRQQMVDTATETSVPHLLRYEDRNSMHFSIESRVPFLTPKLVDFMLSLPEEYVIAPDGTSKAVFRRAMRGIVPDDILDRTDKIGFATPERSWLLALRPWVAHTLDVEDAAGVPPMDILRTRHEWELVLQGKRPFGYHIWRCINLIKWTQQNGISYE
jgi:asparagine synthase (glutamine-hydrolysing)